MVPGSISGGVAGFFSDIFPSDRNMTLRSTQPLVKKIIMNISWGWDWQPHHLHVQNVMKYGSLNVLEPSGPHRACYGTALPIFLYVHFVNEEWCWNHSISKFIDYLHYNGEHTKSKLWSDMSQDPNVRYLDLQVLCILHSTLWPWAKPHINNVSVLTCHLHTQLQHLHEICSWQAGLLRFYSCTMHTRRCHA